ncbi:MAG: hypothetical protein ABIK64_09315, partial [Bacillota bacterium]
MTKGAKAYLGFITLCGLALLGYAGYQYILSINLADLGLEIQQMVCLIVLCVCCSSLPIVISSKQQALDISVISILAAVVVKGPYAAMVVYFISSLFVVKKLNNKHHHILNTPFSKTAFKTSNLMIAIFVTCVLLFGNTGFVGELLPHVILPSALFTVFTFLLNS